jgi:ATP-dependent helicase/nuclease subunit B
MQARFLLGPAGSGKTFRCLSEIRRALIESSEGPPLVLVAPKQSTYQLERQLLTDPLVAGYTRLHILSFERLAGFVFDFVRQPRPEILGDEGRLMVLRALLAKHRDQLRVFRASARLTGFSAELGLVLQEFQRNQMTPALLREVAAKIQNQGGLAAKLQDLATMLELYAQWLAKHNLQDPDCLLKAAAESLRPENNHPDLAVESQHLAGLWLDGFAEYSPQELDLLIALAPRCAEITLAFCLDAVPRQKASWLSSWCVIQNTFEQCQKRFHEVSGMRVTVEILKRNPLHSRFESQPVLQHLEQHWDDSLPFETIPPGTDASSQDHQSSTASISLSPRGMSGERAGDRGIFASDPAHSLISKNLRVVTCKDPQAEATLAAREILRHVRAGGRFRDVAVLVRKLQPYHAALQRVFSRYEIPFFLDRREPVAHHPLVEFTRSALRIVVLGWQTEDLFAAFKAGLLHVPEEEIDRLENEALARGWNGAAWLKPFVIPDDPGLNQWLKVLLDRLLPPFQRLALALTSAGAKSKGPDLAAALRRFWSDFNVEEQLQTWSAADPDGNPSAVPSSVHATVWGDLETLLTNVELAFRDESIPLKEWLAILEAGLANLTVGVIPPALDQVLIGAIDRSRNPDIKLALVLGLNETVFPALPETGALLTDADRAELDRHGLLSHASVRRQLSRERYYAYIACTRARERLVLASALHDADGGPLNPSPFLAHLKTLFPSLPFENHPTGIDSDEAEHVSELIVPLLKTFTQSPPSFGVHPLGCSPSLKPQSPPIPTPGHEHETWPALTAFPGLAGVLREVRRLEVRETDSLPPDLAHQLYGPVLRTSVSRLEVFAACQFRFFVHSGLRAEERKLFELDAREQGSFQHDALALFHSELRREGLRWRDITPAEARRRLGQIAQSLIATYRNGLLQATEQSRFMGRMLSDSLQDFIETLVEWMASQYEFDPAEVELPFGEEEGLPAHEIDLGGGIRLALKGRIDRVDLLRQPGSDEALCVVVDYKSSQKQLDQVLLENGLQLQLLTYLNLLRHLKNPQAILGASRLIPSGVFYVSLRGKYDRKANREEALEDIKEARKLAYQHSGRFDLDALPHLDARTNADRGDQFVYRVGSKGDRKSREALNPAEFEALLDLVEASIKRMGIEIFSGSIKVSPFRKGSLTACQHCDYRSICRIDPWTHQFRVLRAKPQP